MHVCVDVQAHVLFLCVTIFAFVFLHGCILNLTFPYSVEVKGSVSGDVLLDSHRMKDELENSRLSTQKYLTYLASALLSALLFMLYDCGKANPAYLDMDTELSSLCAWHPHNTGAK